MRSDLQEPDQDLLAARRLRERICVRPAADSTDAGLEPQAVDAALADESMPMIAERGSRRKLSGRRASSNNVRRSIDVRHASTAGPIADESSETLLHSLAEQLDLLYEQQRQIRRLLDQAGRLRIDAANH